MKHVTTTLLVLALSASPALGQEAAPAAEPAAPATPSPTPTPTAPEAQAIAAKSNPLANAVQARTPEEQANQSGFQFGVTLDHYLGTGTFADPTLYAAFSGMLTVQPVYLFRLLGTKFALSGTGRVSWEYSLADSATARRVQAFDTRFGLSAPAVFREPVTKIAFSPSLGVVVPTSLESWNAGLVTSLSLGFSVSRSFFSLFDIRLSFSGTRGIYTSRQNAAPASDRRDGQGNLVVICRPGELFCDFNRWNPTWGFSVGGSIQFRLGGSLLVYAGYSFAKGWSDSPGSVDEFSPKGTTTEGNPVVRILEPTDRVSGFLGLSYQLNEHYSLDLGVSNAQQALSPTGQVRFPWFNFNTPQDNTTSIYISLAATY